MYSMIARNTLVSRAGLNKILLMPHEEELYASLQKILIKFQEIKTFASEIHTETHLIKPMLRLLGYAYESKPKFFEEQIKGPDAALFSSDEERVKNSSLWGTVGYYFNTLGILLLKRYGRNLEEGISGFYLEFENRIPIYQTMYLLKKSKTPWGILTDGKYWILIKKPVFYETKLIGIDLENALLENRRETLHLFYNTFSPLGLMKTLPEIIEQERSGLFDVLKEKKTSVRSAIQGLKKKSDIFPKLIDAYRELYSDTELAATETYLRENNVTLEKKYYTQPDNVSEYNISDIAAYLFNKKGYKTGLDLEEVFLNNHAGELTKECILSLKILDMTPDFGNIAAELIEGIAYLSFILPYRERNTFVTEWENETSLKRCIVDRLLFGIEKSPFAYDVFHGMMKSRFKTEAKNYKFGNPLIGMSLSDVPHYFDTKSQMGLFSKNPSDFLNTFRHTFRRYLSLSERIKEDVQIRKELDTILKRSSTRIRDVMDIITSTYFSKTVDNKKINDVLSNLDSDESTWNNLSSQDWFVASKGVARRNGFFHFELEFPFLLDGAFDFIFAQPALQHIWEEPFPFTEVTKAYIKRGMPYLKSEGSMVIILEEHLQDGLMQELSQSKRYETEIKKGVILLRKKKTGHL
jgi:hypothetical protein